MAYQPENLEQRQKLIPEDSPLETLKTIGVAEKGAGVQNLKGSGATQAVTGSIPGEKVTPNNFDRKLIELKQQLQTALELEHSTIPPYLCALYSIKPNTNLMATEIIRSVVLEEMLHMIMVANLINAVGGTPMIGAGETGKDHNFIPGYPTSLPGNVDPSLTVNLSYFSRESIRTFWKIEHPTPDYKLPDDFGSTEKSYPSIGAFYEALMKNIVELEELAQTMGHTIFTGKAGKQVTAEHYYGAGGKLFTVTDLIDAAKVLDEIVGQGEGALGSIFSGDLDPDDPKYLIFGPGVSEFAHYFRFKEVHYGRFYAVGDSAHRDSHNKGLPTGEPFEVDWDQVCKMKANPKMKDYKPGTPIYDTMYDFNRTYSALLDNINTACNGKPEVLREGITMMYELKYKAIELMNIPVPGGDGYTAGPSFEYVK